MIDEEREYFFGRQEHDAFDDTDELVFDRVKGTYVEKEDPADFVKHLPSGPVVTADGIRIRVRATPLQRRLALMCATIAIILYARPMRWLPYTRAVAASLLKRAFFFTKGEIPYATEEQINALQAERDKSLYGEDPGLRPRS